LLTRQYEARPIAANIAKLPDRTVQETLLMC
jgi:hypothetical protein